ncbi:MAG: cupin domain-containing protein [Bacteroidia bacterium]
MQNPCHSTSLPEDMHPDARVIAEHFQFDKLPVEGTLFKSTYRSAREFASGAPFGTAMIGFYCEKPLSVSCFHRLTHDEIWHFYGGDPLVLYLLYENGTSREIVMGSDPAKGHEIQFVVPAGVWQGGCLIGGGRYALFGCTMAPGFTGNCFEGANAEVLIQQFPDRADIIRKLSVNGHETRMPDGFAS